MTLHILSNIRSPQLRGRNKLWMRNLTIVIDFWIMVHEIKNITAEYKRKYTKYLVIKKIFNLA